GRGKARAQRRLQSVLRTGGCALSTGAIAAPRPERTGPPCRASRRGVAVSRTDVFDPDGANGRRALVDLHLHAGAECRCTPRCGPKAVPADGRRAMSRRMAVIGASLLTATAATGAQDPVFSSKVEAVRVDVLVTERDKGGVVRGLQPGDFELLDNGVAQQVDLVSFEQIPLNVVLAFDMSESVSGDRLDQLRDASAKLVSGVTKDAHAGVVTHS